MSLWKEKYRVWSLFGARLQGSHQTYLFPSMCLTTYARDMQMGCSQKDYNDLPCRPTCPAFVLIRKSSDGVSLP